MGFRAVVIGASGGIGAAICTLLNNQSHLGELVAISRSRDGFDLLQEETVAAAAKRLVSKPVHLLVLASGVLTLDGIAPEKAMRQIDPEVMLRHFRINAVGPALVAKHFLPLLDPRARSIGGFLSARVGSIGDNKLGGWISYRSSKAALNQIVRTVSIELKRTHPLAAIAAVHPGTVRTQLSEPYSKGHRTVNAQDAAAAILHTLDALPADRSGSFVAYDGSSIEW